MNTQDGEGEFRFESIPQGKAEIKLLDRIRTAVDTTTDHEEISTLEVIGALAVVLLERWEDFCCKRDCAEWNDDEEDEQSVE